MTRAVAGLAALALAGCFPPSDYQCDFDSDCGGGDVCARTHQCEPPSEVRSVRVVWTIAGQPDAATGCAAVGMTELTMEFLHVEQPALRFAPVPCAGGLFTIDKLPISFDQASLSGNASDGTFFSGSTSLAGTLPEYPIILAGF